MKEYINKGKRSSFVNCSSQSQSDMNAGISILRIIAMIWVILFHFSDHGVVDMITAQLNASWLALAFGRLGGGIGNCIFVLVTGYVLYGREYSLYRIIKLWLEIFFYSVVIGCVAYVLHIREITFSSVLGMLLPIISREYWYMSTYFALYILYPFILYGIDRIDKRYYRNLLFILLALFSFIPTVTHAKWLSEGGNLPIFITLFLLGAYTKKYEIFQGEIKLKKIWLLVVTILLTWGSEVFLKMIAPEYSFYLVWEMWKLPVVMIALQVFLIFKGIGKRMPNIVNSIAQSVSGVYLIHIGRLGNYLFKGIINNSVTFDNSIGLCVQMVLSTLIIFGICTLIDRCRIRLLGEVEKRISNIVYRKIQGIESKIYGFYIVH